jgi:proteasome accessory factor A
MFGLETEYAVFGLSPGGELVGRDVLLNALLRELRTNWKCVPHRGDGDQFLANGARFYFDCGEHPEFTTPECLNPWDAVRYVLAGERMLASQFDRVAARTPDVGQIVLHKTNVDYAGTGATWGCHESYLYTGRPTIMQHQIVPHLVSRLAFTGAGGFDSTSRGIVFTLSPRVAHLEKVQSMDSTSDRGIVHGKDETLSGGAHHRLHLLCGESQRSELSAWLKVGTTALVVAMIEAGLRPTHGIELAAPLMAMAAFAGDPTCRKKVPLERGGEVSALEMQWHLLDLAEHNVDAAFMPPWAGVVCRAWRDVLTRLERLPASLGTSLDWAIKLELFRERARRRGVSWESLPVWTAVVAELNVVLPGSGVGRQPDKLGAIIGPDSPVKETVERLTPQLQQHGLRWEQMRDFVDLRHELWELDVRYGQIGDAGLFSALDAGGVLTHHVPGVDNIEHAMEFPPSSGRARLRGEVVRRLAGHPRCRCSWERVWTADKVMDISDPFESREKWSPIPREATEETPDDLLAF